MSALMEATRYDAEKHEYWRGDKKLDSITSIINAVWKRTDNAPEDAIERARLRGTFVDEKFMEYLTVGSVTIPAGTPQEYADCLGQAVDWWQEYHRGQDVMTQVKLFGETEAGTADILTDEDEIIDLKSTWEVSKTVPAQLGGYGSIHQQIRGLARHEIHFGVLHVHRRFKKAQFRIIKTEAAFQEWEIVRSFYRLVTK